MTSRQDPREAFPVDIAAEFEDWCDRIDPPTGGVRSPLRMDGGRHRLARGDAFRQPL